MIFISSFTCDICLRTGIHLESIETNGDRCESVASTSSPLFQTQPPELESRRNDSASVGRKTSVRDAIATSHSTVAGSGPQSVCGTSRLQSAKSASSTHTGGTDFSVQFLSQKITTVIFYYHHHIGRTVSEVMYKQKIPCPVFFSIIS